MDLERLIKDLLILGGSLIVGAIISINDFFGIRTEFCSDFGINSSSGSIAIFALFIGYVIASYIVGFKPTLELIDDDSDWGTLAAWVVALMFGHIVGMFLLPIRIIKNIIGLFL